MRTPLLTAALGLFASATLAQDDPVVPQRVEIVGSRVPRLAAEEAVPVQIITRAEIARSGVDNVEQLLDRVSANFGGHREAMGLGDGDTPGLSAASLRGFGNGETLVLLNGRRLANYAFTSTSGPAVDLHVIPLAAIERVEILKDGASALYGSDAIAGVINFVTRQDYSGAELALGTSATEHGGGGHGHASAAGGWGDAVRDGFNLFGVLDLRESRSLRANQRAFASTGYRPELGLVNLSPAAWPANIRTGPTPRDQLSPFAPDCPATTVFYKNSCWFDSVNALTLEAPSRQVDALGRGTLRLPGDAEAYAEVLAATNTIQFRLAPSPGIAGVAPYVLPATSPYYPTNLDLAGDLNLAYRTAPLGQRRSEVRSDSLRVLAGVRWRMGPWDLDSAAGVNATRARERYLSGYIDSVRLSQALATGLVNPFGPSGPEGDALLRGTVIGGNARDAVGRTQQLDLRASRELVALAGGPMAVALGVEGRHETLRDSQKPIAAEIVGATPAAQKHGARSAQAAFVELDTPLTKGLEVQAAARLDHYSDFGAALNPKLAIRLQPAAEWLLRASIGRGFRAPSLPELYTQQQSSLEYVQDENGDPIGDPLRCPVTKALADCQPQVQSVSGGNPALRPQHSTQSNAGLVFESAHGWVASIDWWRIDIRDIIGTLDFSTITNDLARYDGRNVIRGPVDPSYPDLPGPIVDVLTINQNLGDWRVDGFDLAIATQPVRTWLGALSAQVDATVVRRARQNLQQSAEINLVGRLVPRFQARWGVNLDQGAWTATLSQRLRAGYVDQNTLPPDESTHRVATYRMWDGQLGYAWSRDVQLTLGVHNLLDSTPPFTNSTTQFQAGFDPAYADPDGRTWTLGLRVAWR